MDRHFSQLTPEKRFQLFLDSASDYSIFFTLPNNDICEWSTSAEKIFGYSEDEALKLNGDVIFTSEDQLKGMPEQEMATALREGQANDERWHVRKDGSRLFAVGRLIALRDESGAHCGFAKILRDATPSKRLEQALQATEAQLRAIVSQAPWGIALVNLDARIEQVNTAYGALLGVSPEQIKGQPLIEICHPEDKPLVQRFLEQCFVKNAESVTFEKRILRADGTVVWVQDSLAILRDAESRPLGILDLSHDITPLKKYEEELAQRVEERTASLRDKTSQMESFCYTVAHDLRAPLRAISGYAQILDAEYSTLPADEARTYFRKIQGASGKLDQLIQDLLRYTTVEQVVMVREDVNLDEVVDKALQWNQQAEIEVVRPLGRVHSDAVVLEHVFSNLLSNAAKFTRPGVSARIRVYTEVFGDRVRVWVEDNGLGVDPRYKDRIFHIFERLRPELNIPGTGLGLAIVAKAMKRLAGTYGVEANTPHGSRFWIELPALPLTNV